MADDELDLTADALPEGVPAIAGEGENYCSNCGGDGKVDGQDCGECAGSGRVVRGIGGA